MTGPTGKDLIILNIKRYSHRFDSILHHPDCSVEHSHQMAKWKGKKDNL